MHRMRGLIGTIEEDMPDEMTELAYFDLPATDGTARAPETALDELETTIHETGNAILSGSGAAVSRSRFRAMVLHEVGNGVRSVRNPRRWVGRKHHVVHENNGKVETACVVIRNVDHALGSMTFC